MATRSGIARKTKNGYEYIYCHWDGYPSHHYPIITINYNTEKKLDKLFKYGNLSVLDKKCIKPRNHSFETPVDGYCIYYGRDRKEKNQDTKVFSDINDLKKYLVGSDIEYLYMFEDGKWNYDKN
jgi:hypothetical protein